MSGKKVNLKDLIPTWLPSFFFIATLIFLFKTDMINARLLGLSDIINSIITFTSIIIGVLIALFGIIVTISDADIMKEIRDRKGEKTLFKYCVETLVSNFLLLLLSIVFQSLINYIYYEGLTKFINAFSYIWFSLVIFVLVSSLRTIYYLLMISFNQKNNTIRPVTKKMSQKEIEDLRKRYTKK